MCKFLINRGCQYDLVDKLKKTPLYFAKLHKHTGVVEYLVSLKEQSKKPKEKEREKEKEKEKENGI
jgi:ankyrin repeat protein